MLLTSKRKYKQTKTKAEIPGNSFKKQCCLSTFFTYRKHDVTCARIPPKQRTCYLSSAVIIMYATQRAP